MAERDHDHGQSIAMRRLQRQAGGDGGAHRTRTPGRRHDRRRDGGRGSRDPVDDRYRPIHRLRHLRLVRRASFGSARHRRAACDRSAGPDWSIRICGRFPTLISWRSAMPPIRSRRPAHPTGCRRFPPWYRALMPLMSSRRSEQAAASAIQLLHLRPGHRDRPGRRGLFQLPGRRTKVFHPARPGGASRPQLLRLVRHLHAQA